MAELGGVCVPICTPFDRPGDSVDEGALKAHIDRMIESGVDIILSCGGTGEFAYLNEAERLQVHKIAGKQIKGRAGFMAHTSAISTRDAIENCKAAIDLGAESVMVLPPYFEGPTLDGVMVHYERVAKAAGTTPIVVYNIPQSSNRDITPAIMTKLMQHDNIRHIKDSTGNLPRIQELIALGAKVFNGGDPITFEALVGGCIGCIWGAGNAMPREAVRLFELVRNKQLVEAAALWKRLLPSQLFFWSHDYNPSIKAATNLRGGKVGNCRMPLQPLGPDDMRDLKRALAAIDA
jgi:4-hydroxy-tetrahydrodipicolinate synthase